jgi:hypothetical protein
MSCNGSHPLPECVVDLQNRSPLFSYSFYSSEQSEFSDKIRFGYIFFYLSWSYLCFGNMHE